VTAALTSAAGPVMAPLAAASSGWRYAAWVAVDLRLLIFVMLVSALTAAGVAALVVRGRRAWDYASVFVVAFALTLGLSLAIFNGIAQYPVFVIESFFPFP